MKVYVASSWRNLLQQGVVGVLQSVGIKVYDFRNPGHGKSGFSWSELDKNWKDWTTQEYRMALGLPLACDGFKNDFDAMKWADCCVLVLPCGRSAHLEAGWFAGAGKPLHILMTEQQEPELMYKFGEIHTSLFDLLGALGVKG